MTFLVPAFLAGLLAAAVPIAIHLINRRRTKLVPIATLRFLRKIPARTIRRRRIEEYLLLAARIAVLALLALGAARPVLKEAQAAGGATAVAVVLDDSYSMGLRVDGITRFQNGVEATLTVLRTLSEGDRAALLPSSDPEGAVLVRDLPGLRRRVGAAKATLMGSSLLAAATRAMSLLREAAEPNRELVLVTDLQHRAVEPLLRGLGRKVGDEAIRVLVIDVGPEGAANASVLSVDAGGGVAVAGEALHVTAKVRNGGAEAITTRVSLVLGEERVAESQVSLPPGETVTVPLRATLDDPGVASGRVFLPGDDLLTDDVRHLALPVMGKIPVLLVDGDPSPIPYQDEAFFLRAALAPEELGAEGVRSPVNLRVVTPEEFDAEDLGPYHAVILANAPPPSPRRAAALRAFVHSGGGLLIFGGSRVSPKEMNRQLGTDPDEGLLPAVLGPPPQLGDDPDAVIPLGDADHEHALFADLTPESLRDLAKIHVRRALAADARAAGGRVVASLETGEPLIVERRAGRGRVMLFTTSADADWGNLPIRPLFLPLLHRAVRMLAGAGTGGEDHLVGSTVAIPPPRDGVGIPQVTSPGGDVRRLAGGPGPRGTLDYGPLTETGIYRVDGSGAGDTFLFAANVDAREGDLARADPAAIRAAIGEGRCRVTRDVAGLAATLVRSREGRPLWGFFLGAALLLLLTEGWFANRVAHQRAEREAKTEKEEVW